jgi:hypothetical protein
MTRIAVICVVILALVELSAFATSNDTLVADYTPHLNGHSWPRVPVVTYVESASNLWVHSTTPNKFPTVQEIHDKDSDFTTVVLRFPDGTVFKTYNEFVLGPYLSAVYSGDFNGDGIPDYVAIQPTTGCGIAGEQSIGVFAFSDGKNYRFTRIRAWGLGPHDLVIDPASKEFRFMQTTFVQGETLDGRYHSFWVHRFFQWEDGSFRSDPGMSPIWVQYLDRPNHEPTKLLNPKLKAKIWSEDLDAESRIEF